MFFVACPYIFLLIGACLSFPIVPIALVSIVAILFIVSWEKKWFLKILGKNTNSDILNLIDRALVCRGRWIFFYRLDEDIVVLLQKKSKSSYALFHAKKFVRYGWKGIFLVLILYILIIILNVIFY